MPVIRADYFAQRHRHDPGAFSMIVVIGQIGGPMIAGILADMTGDLPHGICHGSPFLRAGSAFFLVAKRPARPMRGSVGAASKFGSTRL